LPFSGHTAEAAQKTFPLPDVLPFTTLYSPTEKTLLEIAWYPCYCVLMIQSFKTKAAEDIFNGKSTKAARNTCPKNIWKIASRKLDQLDSAVTSDELLVPPGNRLETLTGDRKGQYSIHINKQYRICFVWTENGPADVEITDYH
jgi:proteic killer suppression protein